MPRVVCLGGGRAGSYGRLVVFDLDQGWRTERLELEPLSVAHAAELGPVLDDTALHTFTGGAPLARRLWPPATPGWPHAARPAPLWGNWVLRLRTTGAAVGTVQATLPAAGPAAGPAEIAWVIARPAQGHGYAKEAARSLADGLQAAGWPVTAYIHPGHLASQRVARAAGLVPAADVRDGEIRWASPPAAAP